ncbi:MAG: ATP-binding protein [Desulfonatronovibrio sp.]
MNPARILIVEDEGLQVMALKKKLTTLGYSLLRPVARGEEAVEVVRDENPDLVLMDIHLAGNMDGITAARHIQSISGVPIVYVTGHSDAQLLQRAKETQPYNYLLKPVSIKDLKVAVDMALHQYSLDKKLEQSEARYRSIVENITDALFIHDFQGRISDVNQNACLMLGYERKELIGSDLDKLLNHKDSGASLEWKKLIDKYPCNVLETTCVCKDGNHIPVEVSFKLVSGESAGIIQSFFRDISERREFQGELIRKNQELEKTLAERDRFFSIIAHDLRSPFIGFLNFIRLLSERFKKISFEDIQKLTTEMKHSAESLYNLLENLLEWSMFQRNEVSYSPSACCLESVVKEINNLVRSNAACKNISLQRDMPADLYVFADKSMLSMILRNLMYNAVKFSHNNGAVRVSARPEGSMVRVSVADEGVGMDRDALEKLFLPGRMSSRKGTGGEKGTGLGLLLCKEYVVKHGGEIWAESTPGKGTVFYFTLPAGSREIHT